MHDLLPLLHLLFRQKASVKHLRQPVNVKLLSDEYLKIGVQCQYLSHMQFVQRYSLPFLVYGRPTLDIGMRSQWMSHKYFVNGILTTLEVVPDSLQRVFVGAPVFFGHAAEPRHLRAECQHCACSTPRAHLIRTRGEPEETLASV